MTRHPWEVAVWQPRFLCLFERVRGGFDVFAGLAGALDDRGDKVDPVLREIITVVPGSVGIDAVGVLQRDRVDGELVAELYRRCPAESRRTSRSSQGVIIRAVPNVTQNLIKETDNTKPQARHARSHTPPHRPANAQRAIVPPQARLPHVARHSGSAPHDCEFQASA
jgi:hypothetical protein